MKEESSDEFQDLRKTLVERLENTWKDLDEDVLEIIDEILHQHGKKKYLPIAQRESLRNALFMSVRRMDILEELLENDDVTEIMINGWNKIFIEKDGKIEAFEKSFSSPEKLEDVIQQMASKCNRVINTLQPIVDARLAGGERINAVIAPVALDGPVLTIRKFPEKPITMERLLKLESITEDAAIFLEKLMKAGYTILIGGGTGSGKTTFLNMLSTLDKPSSGKILLEGQDITALSNKELSLVRRDKIGFIFQSFNLISSLNVWENIIFPISLDGKKIDEAFLKDIIQTLGLEKKLHNLPNTLSGGQQQRVAIARAIASKPEILLADEPTGNLDSKTSAEVMGMLKMSVEKYGQTLVMITHDEDIAQIADRILVIEDGKVAEFS